MQTTPMIALALLLLAAPAMAQQDPEIDYIVASHMEPGEPADTVWNVTKAELEQDHPAVARAVAKPNFIVTVADSEEASTQAFFDQMNERDASAVSVDGELYQVGITIGQAMLPPGDGSTSTTPALSEGSTTSKGAPFATLGLVALAVGLTAAVLNRRHS